MKVGGTKKAAEALAELDKNPAMTFAIKCGGVEQARKRLAALDNPLLMGELMAKKKPYDGLADSPAKVAAIRAAFDRLIPKHVPPEVREAIGFLIGKYSTSNDTEELNALGIVQNWLSSLPDESELGP